MYNHLHNRLWIKEELSTLKTLHLLKCINKQHLTEIMLQNQCPGTDTWTVTQIQLQNKHTV